MFAVSAFAYSEEDAESDRNQQRAVLACIGIVALVGAIYMISKMDYKEYNSVKLEKDSRKNEDRLSFDFGSINNLENKDLFEKNRDPAMGIKIKYSF